MSSRRKFLIFILVGAVLFSASACTRKAEPEKPNSASAVQTETPELSQPAPTETPKAAQTAVPTETPAVTKEAVSGPDETKKALLGYWQEGYSHYLEFKEDEFILRDGMKEIVLITGYSLEEEDGKIRIVPEEDGLCYNYTDYGVRSDQVFATVPEIWFADGQIEMKYLRSYLPDESEKIVFEKTEKGPFDDIIIRDDEFLSELQGKWKEVDGTYYTICIDGNTMQIGYEYEGEFSVEDQLEFHIISYSWAPERLYLIHKNLVNTEFYAFTQFEYEGGLLHTNEIVFDADWDTSIDFEKVQE